MDYAGARGGAFADGAMASGAGLLQFARWRRSDYLVVWLVVLGPKRAAIAPKRGTSGSLRTAPSRCGAGAGRYALRWRSRGRGSSAACVGCTQHFAGRSPPTERTASRKASTVRCSISGPAGRAPSASSEALQGRRPIALDDTVFSWATLKATGRESGELYLMSKTKRRFPGRTGTSG